MNNPIILSNLARPSFDWPVRRGYSGDPMFYTDTSSPFLCNEGVGQFSFFRPIRLVLDEPGSYITGLPGKILARMDRFRVLVQIWVQHLNFRHWVGVIVLEDHLCDPSVLEGVCHVGWWPQCEDSDYSRKQPKAKKKKKLLPIMSDNCLDARSDQLRRFSKQSFCQHPNKWVAVCCVCNVECRILSWSSYSLAVVASEY